MREGAFRVVALVLFVGLIIFSYSLVQNQSGTLTLQLPQEDKNDTAAQETASTVHVSPDTSKVADDVVADNNPAVTSIIDEGADFFIDYKLERERTRSYQQEMLENLVNNQNLDDQSRKQAAQQILSVSDAVGKEMEIENMVKAKGFADALVLLDKDSVMVVVKATSLGDTEVAKIVDIVTRATGVKMDKVIVLPKA